MGAALAIVITFSISVLILRLATVALQIAGLSKDVAKFQALSAFSGSGFTSAETEQVVNFPVRRKVISYLMVIGNLGIVAVLSTLVIGFVQAGRELESVLSQLGWILGGVVIVWFFLLSATGERLTHKVMRWFLLRFTELGRIPYETLLQVGDEWSIAEHRITHQLMEHSGTPLADLTEMVKPGKVIAIKCKHGTYTVQPDANHLLVAGESLILFTTNAKHAEAFRMAESADG